MSVRIYVEGGFQGSTKSDCRQGFATFFAKVLPAGSFKVIASGSRSDAFKDFCGALPQHPADFIVLLVDSEAPVAAKPRQHLKMRQGDKWRFPSGVTDDQIHLMVQVMESWFLADPETLSTYYEQGFLGGSLPVNKTSKKSRRREFSKV